MTPTLRRIVTGFIAGVCAFALAVCGGTAWANWTAQATGTGTVTPPSIAVTSGGFSALGATYINTLTKATSTGAFTVTNTGATTGTVSATLQATGALAPMLTVSVWTVADASACTASATAGTVIASGTWGTTLTLPSVAGVATGGKIVYCVRTALPVSLRNAAATATGTNAASATLSATLTGAGWSASATSAASFATAAIYPLTATPAPLTNSRWVTITPDADATMCLDTAGNAITATNVIAQACGTLPDATRVWQLMPVDSSGSLVEIRPAHAPDGRLTLGSTGLRVETGTAAANQRWYMQDRGGSRYQLVSAATGECVKLDPTNAGQQTVTDCTGTGVSLQLRRVAPTVTGSGAATFTVNFGYTQTRATVVLVQVQVLGGLVWLSCNPLGQPAGVTSITCADLSLGLASGGTVRIIANKPLQTDDVYTTFTIVRTGGVLTLGAVTG